MAFSASKLTDELNPLAYILVRTREVSVGALGQEYKERGTWLTYNHDLLIQRQLEHRQIYNLSVKDGGMTSIPMSSIKLLNLLDICGYRVVSQSSIIQGDIAIVTTWTLRKTAEVEQKK